MRSEDFYIEPPKRAGIEFFLQKTAPRQVAASAHIHESIELLYAKAGSFTVLLDGAEYEFSAGDLILFCSNSIHHITAGDGEENSYYVIKVKPSLLFDLSSSGQGAEYVMRFAVNRPEQKCFWKRDILFGGAIQNALNALVTEFENGGYAAELAMRLRAAELLLSILRDGSATDSHAKETSGNEMTGRIYAAVIYVRRHFGEDIDARALSQKLGVSYSYFSRSFGRITGQSFKEYLNFTRVNHAEQMLLTTTKSVTEIAAECGYNNVSYFISVYRRMKGTTPRRFSRGAVSNGNL